MSRLDEMQLWIATQLRQRRALYKSAETTQQAARELTGNDRLLPVEQLEIYREQFWLRHTSALLEDFPGLSGVLGQTHWERLVEGYLSDNSSASWTLRDLGAGLPAYVESFTDLPHHALCVDMAHLEWAYIELFDAPDGPSLDAARLAGLSEDAWQRARIVLSPALRLLAVKYPVADLRGRLRRRARDGPSEGIAIPDRDPRCLVLYREQQTRNLHYARVSRGAFSLLQHLERDLGLVAACEAAVSDIPDEADSIARNVGPWFQRWAKRGWIVDVEAAKS